ncbi:non-ribosomal peptide synthetase [Streptomyces sp. NPDC055808]
MAAQLNGRPERQHSHLERQNSMSRPVTEQATSMSSFPLTAVQRSYCIGRQDGQPLGGTACHMYFEFDGARIDAGKLDAAFTELQIRHPMLRARFPDTAHEACTGETPCRRLVVYDAPPTRKAAEEHLERVRAQMSAQRLDTAAGQVMDLRLSSLSDGTSRLHIDVDLMAADPPSIRLLLADLAALCAGHASSAPAGQYAAYRRAQEAGPSAHGNDENPQGRQRDSHPEETALPDTWDALFEQCGFNSPRLPLTCDPQGIEAPRFERRNVTVPAAQWRRVREQAAAHGLDPEAALLAAFACTLARWSENDTFLLNVPVFVRPPDPDLRETVGDFTRLTVLPIDMSPASPIRTLEGLVRHVADTLAAAGRGSTAPSLEEVQHMARRRGERLPPLGVVYTSLTDEPWVDSSFEATLGSVGWMRSQTPQVWLDCIVHQYAGGRRLAWDVVAELFPPGMHEAMTAYCADILRSLAERDWSSALPAHLSAGQQSTREAVNNTRREQSGRLLHERFFTLAAQDQRAAALMDADRTWTRATVADTALRLAAHLRARGLREGEPVAVTLASGIDQIEAVLGVLAAGGCYVPISPDQPESRRATIHATAGIRFAVQDGSRHRAGPGKEPGAPTGQGGTQDLTVVTLAAARDSEPLDGPVRVPPTSPAYIIFTSGSTGRPKGVQVSHQSVVNTLEDINERWDVGPDDRGIVISSLDFDLSVYEIFGPLGAGGAVVVPAADDRRDPHAWLRLMEQHQVTVWDSVPVLLDMLISTAESGAPPPALRLAMTGGDWIGLDLPGRLHALLPDCRFVACGGATEGSVYSNYFEVDEVDPAWVSVPYGRPLGNQAYRVADSLGNDCPDWVAGELWIGGAGVADGYVNDPRRTEEHFVEHQGARWYRTGDMGRYRDDGVLEFLGRNDHQVKINGYRIELGEIESAVAAHSAVARCVAVVAGEDTQRRLVAYVVPSGGDLDLAQVTGEAADRLPEYARPADYFLLTDLPLGSNGKVDRKTLASWAVPDRAATPQEPPAEGTEEELARIWGEILPQPVASRHDNFFDVGGNSLLAAKLTSGIRHRYGAGFTLRTVLRTPTLAGMARQIDRMDNAGDTKSSAAGDSPVQQSANAQQTTRTQP